MSFEKKVVSEKIIVEKNINDVWNFLDFSEENMKKRISVLTSHTPIEETDEIVGSKYLQKFMHDGNEQSYELSVLEYEENEDYKVQESTFRIEGMFDAFLKWEVKKIDDNKTELTLTQSHMPLSEMGNEMLSAQTKDQDQENIKAYLLEVSKMI